MRRAAEWLRSWLGRQERWWLWQMVEVREAGREECHLAASTLHRWLKQAGEKARARASLGNGLGWRVRGRWAPMACGRVCAGEASACSFCWWIR